MAEEINTPPAAKTVERKAWVPKLTLKEKHQSPTIKVGVNREIVTRKESDGSVTDTPKLSEHKELRYDELTKFPCKTARKWFLWSHYDYSQRDKDLLMTLTVQEIAQAERSGVWPQPAK